MKKSVLLIIVLSFTFAFGSLVLAEEDVPSLLESASSSYKAGDLEQTIQLLEEALDLVREKSPLVVENFYLVTEPAELYGNFKVRESNIFSPMDKMRFYAEPKNYNYEKTLDGYETWIKVDFVVMDTKGNVQGEQENFLNQKFFSRSKIHDFFLNLSINLGGALPAGNYIVEFTVKDGISDKRAAVRKDFVIEE